MIGVLILNLGTPDAPTPQAIKQFLKDFLTDPRVINIPRLIWWPILHGLILPFRPQKVAQAYEKIWLEQGSPLLHHSEQLCQQLQHHLNTSGKTYQVELAMRYGKPSIKEALANLAQHSVDQIIMLPLYPQYSNTTTLTMIEAVNKALQSWQTIPSIQWIERYADHPAYINALANSVKQHVEQHGSPDKLLFSFHGLPQKLIKMGDPYFNDCHHTANLLAQTLGLENDKWQITFQSRFGRAKWLQPYTNVTLEQLAKRGDHHVAVICPGFPTDCLETLEEINMQNRELFVENGGKHFHYIPALNASEDHVTALGKLIGRIVGVKP